MHNVLRTLLFSSALLVSTTSCFGLDYGLLVDASGSARRSQKTIKETAKMVIQSKAPDDRVFVIVIAGGHARVETELTADASHLMDAIGRIPFKAAGGTPLYDALRMCADYFTRKTLAQPRGLILITDGDDTTSELTFQAAMDNLRRAELTLFVIPVEGYFVQTGALNQMVREAGGKLCTAMSSDGRAKFIKEIPRSLATAD